MSRSLVQILARTGMFTDRQGESLLVRAESERRSPLLLLLETGLAKEHEVARTLSQALKIPYVHPLPQRIANDVLHRIPMGLAVNSWALPLEIHERERSMAVAFADPTDEDLLDEISFRSGLNVRVCVAGLYELEQALRRTYFGLERPERPAAERPERPVERPERSVERSSANWGEQEGWRAGGRNHNPELLQNRKPSGIPVDALEEPALPRPEQKPRPTLAERPSAPVVEKRTATRPPSQETGGTEAVVAMQTQTDLPSVNEESRSRSTSPMLFDLIKQLLARIIELEAKVGDISRGQQDLVELLIKDGVLSRKAYLEWLNNRS